MKTILILLSCLTLTFVGYSQKKSIFEWSIVDELVDVSVAKKEGFALSFNQPSSYVYKDKVDINSLCGSDIHVDLGMSNDQYFYFFDIENKKITVVQNRSIKYEYNFSKVRIKNNVLIFTSKEDNKIINIYVGLDNHIFKISEYNETLKMTDVSVCVDVSFYPKK